MNESVKQKRVRKLRGPRLSQANIPRPSWSGAKAGEAGKSARATQGLECRRSGMLRLTEDVLRRRDGGAAAPLPLYYYTQR